MSALNVRGGRLVDPEGNRFLSLGINHADETSLQYPHNLDVWKRRYGSREAWIRDGALADFRAWNVNTIGWTREYVAGGWSEALDWFADPLEDLGRPRRFDGVKVWSSCGQAGLLGRRPSSWPPGSVTGSAP